MTKWLLRYWYLLILPFVAIILGDAMNQLAIVVNGGQMPVFLPASLRQMCIDPIHAFVDQDDTIHSCMTHATHLKFICDWIIIGNPNPDVIMSPGDVFLLLGQFFQIPALAAWLALIWREHIS